MNALCDLWAVNGTVINGVLSKEKKIIKRKGKRKRKEGNLYGRLAYPKRIHRDAYVRHCATLTLQQVVHKKKDLSNILCREDKQKRNKRRRIQHKVQTLWSLAIFTSKKCFRNNSKYLFIQIDTIISTTTIKHTQVHTPAVFLRQEAEPNDDDINAKITNKQQGHKKNNSLPYYTHTYML